MLNKTACNEKQKCNKDECRCQCLKIENCDDNSFRNVVNWRCEHKKAAKLTSEKECKEIIDNILNNKTVLRIKYVENCKPFVTSSILFMSVSIILTGIMIYFYARSKNRDVLPY